MARAGGAAVRRVVIESPFAGDIPANVAYAKRAVRDCLRRGESPYASHLFFTQADLLDDTVPEQRKLGIEAGFVWGNAAELVVVYLDRGVSSGMRLGIAKAIDRGTPLEFRRLDRIEVVCRVTRCVLHGAHDGICIFGSVTP